MIDIATPAPVVTADDLAALMYATMKAPGRERLLFDALQSAQADTRPALLAAASASDRAALMLYAQRRAHWVAESPEYAATLHEREDWLTWIRKDAPARVAALKRFYRNGHIADLIDDFGMTSNPKMANAGRAVSIPFKLWSRQRELVAWMWKHFKDSTPAVCAKAREVGASWIAMAFAASLCALFDSIVVGVVASDEAKLDGTDDPNPTLPKVREFLRNLPPEFSGGFDDSERTSTYLKIKLPTTGSIIRGWTGKSAGRGGRAALVVVDEAAFFENPTALDAALSAVTECRLDFSSANGTGNAFFDKVSNSAFDAFYFRIDDDPRRGKEWQAKKKLTIDPVLWASEYEISFTASVEAQLIEWKWVSAAIGLLALLEQRDGFKNSTRRRAALDVSDQGRDKNCFVGMEGIELNFLELWSGAGSDQHETCRRAFELCDTHGRISDLIYDASSPGAGISGAARILNAGRRDRGGNGPIHLSKFVGGSTAFPNPEKLAHGTDRKCVDFFANLKAFAYWMLRQRFIESWKAFNGEKYDKSLIISIRPDLGPHLTLLQNELAQIQRAVSHTDKLVIDKAPHRQGQPRPKSPNCADALAMLMGNAVRRPFNISDATLATFGAD
jgi:phage terminase large subunit